MYKDKQKQKESDKERAKRYRDRQKGVTEDNSKGVTQQTENHTVTPENVTPKKVMVRVQDLSFTTGAKGIDKEISYLKREEYDLPDREGMCSRKVVLLINKGVTDGIEFVEDEGLILRYWTLSDGQKWDRGYYPKSYVDPKEKKCYLALQRATRSGMFKRNPEEWRKLKEAFAGAYGG